VRGTQIVTLNTAGLGKQNVEPTQKRGDFVDLQPETLSREWLLLGDVVVVKTQEHQR
jgi:hypothetical protein